MLYCTYALVYETIYTGRNYMSRLIMQARLSCIQCSDGLNT